MSRYCKRRNFLGNTKTEEAIATTIFF